MQSPHDDRTAWNIPGTIEAIGQTAGELRRRLADHGLGEEQIYAVELCFEELTMNILRHGHEASRQSPGESAQRSDIGIALEFHADSVRLIIEDNAPPFDVTAAVASRIDKPLAELQPGGLGIHLIKQFSTALHHERTHNGNRVTVDFAT